MKVDPRAIVDAYIDALANYDYERARGLLADSGFRYQSPISRFTSADEFMQYMSLSGGIIQGIGRRKTFVDGDDVCHFLEFAVQLSEKESFRVVQWASVAKGRIYRIEVLFDAHRYHEMFQLDPEGA